MDEFVVTAAAAVAYVACFNIQNACDVDVVTLKQHRRVFHGRRRHLTL